MAFAGAVDGRSWRLLTGVPPLYWFHFVLPVIGAMGLILASVRLLKLLVPDRWPSALAATVVILLTIGDAHAWHGNFGLVRLHQGKGLVVSVLLPLVLAYALEFVDRPDRGTWCRLVLVQIAALGCNPPILWLSPVLVACVLVTSLPGRTSWPRIGLWV